MKKRISLWKDTRGDAVVEAAILFPIIIMVFAGLVLLAVYMPTRAVLQRATQYAATAIATGRSDTWLRFDEGDMGYYWLEERGERENVYASLFRAILNTEKTDEAAQAEEIVSTVEQQGIFHPPGNLKVELGVVNYVIYKVVENGDEFIRNVDLAADFVEYLDEKYEISQVFESVGKVCDKFTEFLGI